MCSKHVEAFNKVIIKQEFVHEVGYGAGIIFLILAHPVYKM